MLFLGVVGVGGRAGVGRITWVEVEGGWAGVQWKYNMSVDSHASPSERSLASLVLGCGGLGFDGLC